MSKYTHVCGCICIDTMPHIGDENMVKILKEKFGRTWSFDEDEYQVNKPTVPTGSEESIQYKILKTGTEGSLDWGLITVWGNLRDYDNPEEIFKWIRTACNSEHYWIRSCCVEVNVNYSKQYLIRRNKFDDIVMTEIFDE